MGKAGESPFARHTGGLEASARGRGLSWGWLFGALAALLYGSLLPFDVDPEALRWVNGFGLLQVSFAATTREDLITNVLVYVPIGLAVVLCGRRARSSRVSRIVAAVFLGALVSLFAESAQTAIASRVASWVDVCLNIFGTALGAAVGASVQVPLARWRRRLRSRLAGRPFATGASLLSAGLLLYHLAPFDFVTDTAALRASFLRARWDLTTLRAPAAGQLPWAMLVAQLTAAAWFAGLAYVTVLARRHAGHHPAHAFASAIQNAFVLIVVIEFMELFTSTQRFDLASIVLRLAGSTLGAWSAAFLLDTATRSRWMARPAVAMPTAILVFLGLFQVAMLLLSCASPVDWSRLDKGGVRVHWMPFEGLWHQPMASAAHQAVSLLLLYGALAITLTLLLRRVHVRPAWLVTTVGVTILAAGAEGLRAVTTTGIADVTDPVLALVATVIFGRGVASLGNAFPSTSLATIDPDTRLQASRGP